MTVKMYAVPMSMSDSKFVCLRLVSNESKFDSGGN
jgi:hypothetical protein